MKKIYDIGVIVVMIVITGVCVVGQRKVFAQAVDQQPPAQAEPVQPAEPTPPPLPPENGIQKLTYESGALKSERSFKNGKADGKAVIYYESGKVMTEVAYKNGKRDGIQRSYYENGKLQEEMELTYGKLNGFHKEYNEQGALISEKHYDSAVLLEEKK